MKRLLFTSLMMLFVMVSKSQSIYNYTEILKKSAELDGGKADIQIDTNNFKEVFPILYNFLTINQKNEINRLESIFEKIMSISNFYSEKNPFIKISGQQQEGLEFTEFDLGGLSKAAGSKLGGRPVTTFADGLAQFLVDRAMQELDVAFFSKFKNFLIKNPEAKILFPTTTDYITNFSPHEYALFIVSLRESFYNDLKNLIYNVDDVFLLPKYAELIDNHPEIIVSINCIQIIVELEEGIHPVDVLEKFKNLPVWNDPKVDLTKKPALHNLYNGIKTSCLLANSVMNVDIFLSTQQWVSVQEFRKNILEDEKSFRIFLGLIYQQAKTEKIEFTYKAKNSDDTNSIKEFTLYMKENKDRLIVFQSLFIEIVQKGTLVEQSINEIRETKNPTKEDFYKYINSSVDIIEFGFKVSTLLSNKEVENRYETYFSLARQGNNLYRNVYQKQYSAAILNASSIFDLTLSLVQVENQDNIKHLRINKKHDIKGLKLSNDTNKDDQIADYKEKYRLNKKNIQSEGTEIKKNLDLIPEILRYGTFMSNVIEAEEPSQVKAAIEAAVLPVGSSTVKKYYWHNFSINAYLGGFVRDKAENVQQSWDARVGFIAPVGFSYTPLSFGKCGALSVFVPLIDVGAVAQFRLSDDTSQIEEDISLGNIFSPGGYLVYGMAWDLPISIGVGGQYGPGLVSFEATSPNVINPSWRLNIFLAVDISLFNLSKGKKLKK